MWKSVKENILIINLKLMDKDEDIFEDSIQEDDESILRLERYNHHLTFLKSDEWLFKFWLFRDKIVSLWETRVFLLEQQILDF